MPSVKLDLRTATREDIPALRENWRASFGDADDYLDFFFLRRFVPEDTLVACVDGKPVSQLFLLPVSLHAQDKILSADYLFAAATHPDFRSQGVMSSLLSSARSFCTDRGKDAIVLLPGSKELYAYYEKRGYEKAFSRRRWNAARDVLTRLAVPVKEAENACDVLQDILSRRDGLCWDADALTYAIAEHNVFRGSVRTSESACVCVSDDETVCLCAPQCFGECAALLLDSSDRSHFSLILPSDISFGTCEDGGMLCRLHDTPIHLRDAFISFAME